MNDKVIVLGCGPAGLLAAHAAAREGADVRIFSKPRKSLMNGAQYLHRRIPDLGMSDSFQIHYGMMGTPDQYRLKVYGPKWDGTVSPEDLAETHPGWDIREAYDELWRLYGTYVQEWEASPITLFRLLERWQPNLLVNTIPAPAFCHQGHQFNATKIYSTNVSMWGLDNNTVMCNGLESPLWYRASRIQNHENTEWSSFTARPPFKPMWDVLKPLKTNCDCMSKMCADLGVEFKAAGRYGKWEKGVLSHEVFGEVEEWCNRIPSDQS